MKEQIVNIFVYGDATHVHAIGWRVYDKAGTYDELTAFLRSRVQRDHRIAARNDLDEPIPWRDFKAVDRVNPTAGSLIGAGIVNEYAVYCLTHIVNGEVRVDGTVETAGDGAVPDYLQLYRTKDGIDFPQLINDDYFEAIHLLWNNWKYVSALKLMFSAIDTWGFVEYGPDDVACFTRWLDEYCDLKSVGVTSGELWEFRNSLIHMTNLDSRKVRSGRTDRLALQIAHPGDDVAPFVHGMKVFHVARFIMTVVPPGDREVAAFVQPTPVEVRRVRRTVRHRRFGGSVAGHCQRKTGLSWEEASCNCLRMKNPFRYFKTSPEIIRLAVMMQVRFPLSLRNVEDLLHERGIEVSHKTIRFWRNRFGPIFAAEIRKKRMDRMRAFSGWRWHLDEMFVKINGEGHYLWRAVDQEGEVLEAFVSKKRDRDAALKFLRKLMKRYGRPDAIITDRGRPNSLSSVENSVLATFL